MRERLAGHAAVASLGSWLVVAVTPAASLAQEQLNPRTQGLDIAAIAPLGPWRDSGANVGIGALGCLDQRLVDDWALIVRGGFFYHFPKTDQLGNPMFREVVLMAGPKLRFGGPYLAVDAGIGWLTFRNDAFTAISPATSVSFPASTGTEFDLVASGGVGYEFGHFDLRAQAMFPGLSKQSEWFAAMATAGYRFHAF